MKFHEKSMADYDLQNVRNLCVLAHVDHGKTTLADHLIAGTSGRHLHPKLAGTRRFMDYLEEEQRRAITMKSSSISLEFNDSESESYSINLIDSPGHVDFCSEVSTAARLSDGALVLVDSVEGVLIQTHAVLRQAWMEKLTPCLVLNKIDRLITELKLTPMDAYTKLLRIVQDVNRIMSGYKSEKYFSDFDSILASGEDRGNHDDDDEEEDTFRPEKGNVAFVCALDGWGFTTKEFADFYAPRFKMNSSDLQKALWGSCNSLSWNKVGKKGGLKDGPPLFVQLVLQPLWLAYESAMKPQCSKSSVFLEKINKAFKLDLPLLELLKKGSSQLVVRSFMSSWLPLSKSVLSMVVRCMPDPVTAQSSRISRLLPKREQDSSVDSSSLNKEAEAVRKSIEVCDSSPRAPCVAFVSKMFAVPWEQLPSGTFRDDGDDSNECFLAFARVFSGVMHSGQKMYVLSALYDPSDPCSIHEHLQETELQSLYVMMGGGLTLVATVKAGNLVAIGGLGQHVLKSATLASTRNCFPFSSMAFQVSPTLRVAVQPLESNPANLHALRKGLSLLNRADPSVRYTVSSEGEYVLSAAGEVHLERCVKDLQDRFAKINIKVSPPLISYRESIKGEGSSDFLVEKSHDGRCVVRVQVMKLPAAVTEVLGESAEEGNVDDNFINALKKRLIDALDQEVIDRKRSEKYRLKWTRLLERMWVFDPGQVGPNILFAPEPSTEVKVHNKEEAESLQNSVVYGFRLATKAGPLCREPMWGLGFVVEAVVSEMKTLEGFLLGQVTGMVQKACRLAVLEAMPCLVEAMYLCELNVGVEDLGAMYRFLRKRRARVLKEEIQLGSSIYTVHAHVPVSESYRFGNELMKETKGGASVVMVMSHWEEMAMDEEFEEESGDVVGVARNTAWKLINSVRRQKGMVVDEQIVKHANRQRTLSRKV